MDYRTQADFWQQFVASDIWVRFTKERLNGQKGYCTNEKKSLEGAVLSGNIAESNYHLGIVHGIAKVVELIGAYHKELE